MTPLPCWTCGQQPAQDTLKSPSGGNSRHAYVCQCGNRTLYYRRKDGVSGWFHALDEWNNHGHRKASLSPWRDAATQPPNKAMWCEFQSADMDKPRRRYWSGGQWLIGKDAPFPFVPNVGDKWRGVLREDEE